MPVATASTASQQDTPGAETRRPAWSSWRPSVLAALVSFLVFRAITALVTLVAAYGVHFPDVLRARQGALLIPWRHWDAGLYELLAGRGYTAPLDGLAAFPPVLPALTNATSRALHISLLAAGLLVTNLALLLALVLLHRLVGERYGGRVATTTVVLLLVWPASFFLGGLYTESLALLFAAAGYFAVSRQRWALAGLLAAGAVMTKFWMVALVLALVWSRLERHGPRRALLRDTVLLVGPTVLALGGWMLYMKHVYGDPLAFSHAQASFNRHLAGPWTLLARELPLTFRLGFLDSTDTSAVQPFDLLTVVLVGAMAVWWWRRGENRSYAVWLGAALAIFVCETVLMGEVRETLILFPVFVGLALIAQRRTWVERLATVVGLPIAVWLITRFVSNAFAG